MSPNEKALHLIELFWCEVEDLDSKEVKMSKVQAIQCALICVDEIINTNPTEPAFGEDYPSHIKMAHDYWQSVKQKLKSM